ncbi:MAG: helix-turn-helix transcriptional regulator [Yoonia sp.]|jgi:transcriptional regulator with XRE-family HTH domain|nr:helix-turn-helix transcriptional regulator [Yoonia sp.]MDG1519019.1 helix-turn-helix transcriptional regulator [Yoonia sp.]
MTPTDDTNWFSDEAATFGDRLAGAREAAGHTQDTLAKQLGVEVTSVDAWENDLREPRANRLQMLSGMLGVSLVWLLTGEGEGPEEPTEVLTDDADIASVLKQMRVLRAEMLRAAQDMGRLEKKLRLMLRA